MAPKKIVEVPKEPEPVVEQLPPEPQIPPEDLVTSLSTGLELPLRPQDVLEIWALESSYSDQAALVTKLLGLAGIPARRDIICDFHLFALIHAKALGLSHRQAAPFHAIMAHLLAMASGVSAKQASADTTTCFKEFQRLLLNHTVNSPPARMAVFNATEAKQIADFATTTFFKHFLLYSFCLNYEQDVQMLHFGVGLQRPLVPPELSRAKERPGRRSKGLSELASGDKDRRSTKNLEDVAETAAPEVTEEEEIEQLVEEKLKETEARLQAMLEAREAGFHQKLAEKSGRH